MQIVIDIPEEVYNAYKKDATLSFLNEIQRGITEHLLINGLVNGIQLNLELNCTKINWDKGRTINKLIYELQCGIEKVTN